MTWDTEGNGGNHLAKCLLRPGKLGGQLIYTPTVKKKHKGNSKISRDLGLYFSPSSVTEHKWIKGTKKRAWLKFPMNISKIVIRKYK